jgi:biotin carboxylase
MNTVENTTKEKCLLLVQSDPSSYYWAEYYNIDYIRVEALPTNTNNITTNTIITDYLKSQDVWPILESLNTRKDIIACYTDKEVPSAFTHLVSKKFNLPYQSCKNYNAINNKSHMRKVINDNGISHVPAVLIDAVDSVSCFFLQHGKSILKPINGFASKNIKVVDEINFNSFIDIEMDKFIIEKFIDGQEYSIEAFSYNGEHKLIGITEKMVDPETLSEKGHIFPAHLSKKAEDSIWNTTKKFLTCLGIENGPSHTEVKVFEEKVYLIETHNRPGGDYIPQLVEMSTGFNTFKNAIGWCAQKISAQEHYIEINSYAASYFIFSPKAGRLKHIMDADAFRWMPGVKEINLYYPYGSLVPKTATSFTRLGHIIVQGKSRGECLSIIQTIEKNINIIIE